MRYRLLLLCIVPVLVIQSVAQDFTGSLPHIPVVCISRFNPESARGKHIFQNLKNLGADALLIPEQGWNSAFLPFGKASVINLTLSDSSHAFDITQYVDAAYSVWEAEGNQSFGSGLSMVLNPKVGVAVPDSGYVRTRGTNPGILIRGPGYKQKMLYDTYGEPHKSPMLYSATFFLRFEKEPWVQLDSSVILADLQVALRHKLFPDSLAVVEHRDLSYGDFLAAETEGWFSLHLLYHLDSLVSDDTSNAEMNRKNTWKEWSDLIEFPVIWKGVEGTRLYVDKVIVSEPRGFSLAHDPMVREYFVEIFRDQKNSHLLDKWFAMPRPSFADSQFPFNTIDSLANVAVALRNEDRTTDVSAPSSAILYLNIREQETGVTTIEPYLYPESDAAFPAITTSNSDESPAQRLLNTVNTGILHGASQVWIDAGLLLDETSTVNSGEQLTIPESESMKLLRSTIIPRLKGEFGRTMKELRNPILTTRREVSEKSSDTLGGGTLVTGNSKTTMSFGVYPSDSAGGSTYLYAVSESATLTLEGDSLHFSVLRADGPFQNYLVRNIITGESGTYLKDESGRIQFDGWIPAGDARLFEIVPAITRKGKRSLLYDEQLSQDIIINRGDTLMILPGVILQLKDGAAIRNSGALIVKGSTDTVRIDFTRPEKDNGIHNQGTLFVEGCSISNGVYGVVHTKGYFRMDASSVTGCSTGVFVIGIEPSPRLVELTNCLVSGNNYGLLAENSSISMSGVFSTANKNGLIITGHSVLVSSNTLQQTASGNKEIDVLIDNSLVHFMKRDIQPDVVKSVKLSSDALLINGDAVSDDESRTPSLVLRALQLAESGDTTASVALCNTVWGEYPDDVNAAKALLVVRYLSSRQSMKRFPVFLDVLSGSSFISPLRFAADMIRFSGSVSNTDWLQNQYPDFKYQDKILFSRFVQELFNQSDSQDAIALLMLMGEGYPDSFLTGIAKKLYHSLNVR